jgi:hypothetical protein
MFQPTVIASEILEDDTSLPEGIVISVSAQLINSKHQLKLSKSPSVISPSVISPSVSKLNSLHLLDKSQRFIIVDNSGSMAIPTDVGISRWEELKIDLKWIRDTTIALGTNTHLQLLNKPDGKIQHSIDINSSTGEELDKMINSYPSGGTPLCRSIRQVYDKLIISPNNYDNVCVIIMTDGESSDGSIESALKLFEHLPSHISISVIVRLCTDSTQLVEYWDNVDNNVEVNLDVIDNIVNEGIQVHMFNPWVAYWMELHNARMFGGLPRIFDIIDERPFTFAEKIEFINYLLSEPIVFPNPIDNLAECRELLANANIPLVYDVHLKTMRPCIDVERIFNREPIIQSVTYTVINIYILFISLYALLAIVTLIKFF